ncbi:MAG: response regulator [Marinifilaceae bacterium]
MNTIGKCIKDWSDKTVLIAEDYDENFIVLKALLKKTNINILRANDGKEAINMVSLYPNIDVILMDITMPELDGMEAARIIRSLNPGKAIIAQTAHERELPTTTIQWELFDDVLCKPILRQELLNKLDKFLS